jgi:hypothetical protein
MHFPAAQMDEKQDVIRHEPAQRPDLSGEEVGRHEDVHVRPDELLPGGRGLALWRWRNAMALEDVAHGLVTDRRAQVGQDPHDAIVAPRAIFLRQAHHQRLQLRVNRGTSWGLALLGAVTLLGHELTVPGEDGVGCDDLRDFLQGLLAQLLADHRQGLALAVTQSETPLELVAQDAVLRHQVLIA